MNVPKIKMDPEEARLAFEAYRAALLRQHSKEDEALMRGYAALKKGRTLIDINQVMKAAGSDAKFRPKLAIARASLKTIRVTVWREGSAGFIPDFRTPSRYWNTDFPRGTFTTFNGPWSIDAKSVVPLIPPQFRPKFRLSNYHILWEATWETVPSDPILLKHLMGNLYAVLAVWDLTPLERAVLAARE